MGKVQELTIILDAKTVIWRTQPAIAFFFDARYQQIAAAMKGICLSWLFLVRVRNATVASHLLSMSGAPFACGRMLVGPAPILGRGQCAGKTALGRRLPHQRSCLCATFPTSA
jgi:hypothetical protein